MTTINLWMARIRRGGIVLASVVILAGVAAGQTTDELAEKVDILAAEVARLREAQDIPGTEEERLEGRYGMSPVASKVYGGNPGLSIGGYGEFYFASELQDAGGEPGRSTADYYRFVAYFGYKFSDAIVMNTELEFEHATTSSNFEGDRGSVSVEFAYLDFLVTPAFNVRAGNLLLPMGFVNTLHEPIFYRGNFRPELERRIIPSTWRELGAGAHGSFGGGFRYTAYVVNGLDGADFSDTGIRGGRQSGNRVAFEDAAVVGAVDWVGDGGLWIGGSYYRGGADQNGMTDPALADVAVSSWIGEIHAQYRRRGLELRAMYALAGIDGADELTGIVYPDGESSRLIPERQQGWYVDLAYDVAPLLFGADASFTLSPWVRFEDLRLQDRVPDLDGRDANPALEQRILTVGLESKPHEQVVVKLDYVITSTEAETDPGDQLRLGAGFAF
jgi:hypothetical protein